MNESRVFLRAIRRVENEPYLSLTLELTLGAKKEKRTLIVPDKVYLELKLSKGEISAECFDRLDAEAEELAAYRRGLSMLGYGASSERRLARKLMQKGFDPENARRAAAALKSEGCINEIRDVEREVNSAVNKLWGERRIISRLYEKGYCDEAVSSARELLESIDFTELCSALIKKRFGVFPTEPKEREKATAALVRYGYSLSEIREARKLLSK